ncbi:MAG: hypothetical protein Q6373_017320 [Candidatus Sigynarchaeota archaeon]
MLRTGGGVGYTTPPGASYPRGFTIIPPGPRYHAIHVFWMPAFLPFPPLPAEIRVDVSFTLV